MRRPRSSSGTGVGSSGIGVSRLSLRRPRTADQVEDLARRAVDVVVGDDMVVVGRVGHLFLGDLPPRRQVPRRLATTPLLAVLELFLRRRDDEDQDRVGQELSHLLGALDIDLEDHVAPGVARPLDPVAKGAVQVAVVARVLEECALGDQVLELFARQEGVVLVWLLVGPRLAGGAGDRVLEVGVELEEAEDHSVLAHARRTRDDDQKTALHSAASQKRSKSGGGGASKLISAPVRGWRRRSRHAWSIGRSAPASRPPYSASPAIGCPSAARWTRIWCVRPVSRSQRNSVWVRLRSTTW